MGYALVRASRLNRHTHSNEISLHCSFCGKGQKKAGKLIASAVDSPRSYICDVCVAICSAIIEDDKIEGEDLPAQELYEGSQSHLLLAHPLAPDLMDAVERLVREQSLDSDALLALAEVRRIASSMLSGPKGLSQSSRDQSTPLS
jgi:ClpX C4-type zinc finger protein